MGDIKSEYNVYYKLLSNTRYVRNWLFLKSLVITTLAYVNTSLNWTIFWLWEKKQIAISGVCLLILFIYIEEFVEKRLSGWLKVSQNLKFKSWAKIFILVGYFGCPSNTIFRLFIVYISIVFYIYRIPFDAGTSTRCFFASFCSKRNSIQRALFQAISATLDIRSVSSTIRLRNHVAIDTAANKVTYISVVNIREFKTLFFRYNKRRRHLRSLPLLYLIWFVFMWGE